MKKIGVNISHDFSICFFENNILKNFWYEDRYNLQKHWPEKLENLNDVFLLSIFKNIDFIPDQVVYASFFRNRENKVGDINIIEKVQKLLNYPKYFFNEKNHHIYHALNAFYFSKLNEAMAIVVDGGGAQPFDKLYQEMETIFYVDKRSIYKLYQHLSNRRFMRVDLNVQDYSPFETTSYINGTEYFFSSKSVGGYEFNRVAELTGFKKGGHDSGKLMGLSSYGYSSQKFDLDYEKVKIAKETQEKTFYRTCELIEKAFSYKKIKNFVLSGGYFLNCSNNFKYVKKYPNFNFFVDPIPTDSGTAIGACIYYEHYR